ncbi:MAG: folylpolyglutamate synthase/dihydrofolate synthase family protein [Raoultibacter sp.]
MAEAFDPVAYINEPRWMESRLGLDRIRELLDRLGNPQNAFKIVHVAGTNGKGSVCSFTASILVAAGFHTGLFTSPYIVEFSDRIKVDGSNISDADLLAATLIVKEQAEAMPDHPTEFELMTAVAFVHFARSGCEIAVVEVGLGGRLDSTNAITAPEVCAIARIALDHTGLLGTTLTQIAGEKAGIIKQGVPVVSWPQDPEAMEVVRRVAAEHDAPLVLPDFGELTIGHVSDAGDVSRETFVRFFSYKRYTNLTIGLLGSYQPYNATLAIEIIEVLRTRGWSISDDDIREGLAATTWPGRFEIAAQHPTFVIDGGHNPQGAQVLADSLCEIFPDQKAVFLMGVLEDKDYPEMLETLLPLGRAFVAVAPPNPRALSAEKLAQAIRWTGQDLLGCSACTNVYVARDIPDAVGEAKRLAGEDGLVCACGSLYSIAEIKQAL